VAEEREELLDEWRALGNIIDRFMFIVSLIVIVGICVWMMASPGLSGAHHGTDEEQEEATSGEEHH